MDDKNKHLYIGLGVLGLALICYAGYTATQTQEDKKPEAPKPVAPKQEAPMVPVQEKVKEETKCPIVPPVVAEVQETPKEEPVVVEEVQINT